MKTLILAAAAGLLAAGTAVPAAAAINAQQLNQERRIDAGRRSGDLTPREARTLRAEQRLITREREQFAADGRLTRREKKITADRQDAAARHIQRLKDNGRRAPSKLKL